MREPTSVDASLAVRMKDLSARLDKQAHLLTGSIVLLDYPVHGNIGDLLIWKGEQEFFARNNKKLLGQFSKENITPRTWRLLDACDTICLHGGGNFGDLWPVQQRFREEIIQRYPKKRIVILPQSVHFKEQQALQSSCDVLKQHRDLHILLRDKTSVQVLSEQGVPNLTLCPDMAHALFGSLSATGSTTEEPLFILRDDIEQGYLPDHVLDQAGRAKDWNDLYHGSAGLLFKFGMRVVWRDRRYGNMLPAGAVWNAVTKRLIGDAVKLFADHPAIMTNRLHAVILGALLGRKVVAYDNSYGKLSTYIDCWLDDVVVIESRARNEAGLAPQSAAIH